MKMSVTQTAELLKVSLAEAEEKHQEAVENIDQLEVEKSNLKHQVEELQGTVLDMGNMLTEIERECDKLINDFERERERHSILKSEYDEMKETLMDKEELLKVNVPSHETMTAIVRCVCVFVFVMSNDSIFKSV
ncbi:leucine-rich repeat flightless-interacting protein 1-like isoform X2 [Ictalurus furcatus]|uniref:leucine-rich repeat flightless-interacting protein 1-like isoform X2 n=1 Tax=Ictalurus furcatus TaxID=66913 RepID=UPI00235030AF|nr:leucine-rich repeat flightless-interacting protein 1-like isoform X2 [Ictalurus furcatus]